MPNTDGHLSESPHTSRNNYVDVIVPLPLEATFTYRVPEHMKGQISVGSRVIVPFGLKKFYTAIVIGTPNLPPEGFEIKDVAMVLDCYPVVRHPQVKLWQWIADYYLCALGDVYRAAVPAGLKIESETFVEINPDYDFAESPVSEQREAEICQQLDHSGGMSVGALSAKLTFKGVPSLVNAMIDRGVLIISEKLVERYRVRYEPYVTLIPSTPKHIQEAFSLVKGAKKQETLLLAMLELSGAVRGSAVEVSKAALLDRAGATSAILSALVKKGILRVWKKEISRFKFSGEASGKLPRLSQPQLEALDNIHKSWLSKDVTLLHGVTSSGKTEIYIHLINFVLSRGDQTLFLVPEIALTTQLTRRLQDVFGEKVVVYHSKFSDNERVDIWKKMLHDPGARVVIGARSSLFLPFSRLGLVIVDEEHESSYKQYDPAPRYNARDVAMVLARMHGAKTLLGSATPAVETFYKALSGKFGLVELPVRYHDVKLPEIRIIDMKQHRATGAVAGAFADETRKCAAEAIARGSQVIFFQNRRGYAPLARCKQCAWTPRCEQCDVALTYHSHMQQLQCHYCGAVYPLPKVCPQCKEPSIEILGYGTERVGEEVEAAFPGAKMLRMDLDSTRNKNSYEKIIDDFSGGKARILVGTQMVTKGLDFGGVEMVGVLNADSIINFPDFRSAERAFNMLEQVSGRAGRREGQTGMVVVQTWQPQHPVISFLKNHDYLGFYNHEILEREKLFYPPFCRIIYMYVKHRDPARLRTIADRYAARLRQLLGRRVFGPVEPAVGRVQGLYIRKIMLKIEPATSVTKIKGLLRSTYIEMLSLAEVKGTMVYYDVDPQ